MGNYLTRWGEKKRQKSVVVLPTWKLSRANTFTASLDASLGGRAYADSIEFGRKKEIAVPTPAVNSKEFRFTGVPHQSSLNQTRASKYVLHTFYGKVHLIKVSNITKESWSHWELWKPPRNRESNNPMSEFVSLFGLENISKGAAKVQQSS